MFFLFLLEVTWQNFCPQIYTSSPYTRRMTGCLVTVKVSALHIPLLLSIQFMLKVQKKKKKSYSASKIPLFVLDGWKSLCRQYSLLNLLFNLIFIFTNISLTASYSHALYNKWFSMLREGAGNARLPSWFFFYCSFAEETKPLQTHPSLLCPLLSTLLYLPDHLDFSKPQTRSHRVCWGKAGYGAHTGDSGWQAAASEFKWKKKWNTHQRVRLQPL